MSAGITVYVVTRDMERMRRFYEVALDIRPGPISGSWLPFSLNGATFALHAAGEESREELQRVNLSFSVDDIEGVVNRFREQGAKILRGIADETFGRMSTLEDPEGRAFEVVQYR